LVPVEILEDDGDPGTPGVQVVGPDVGAVDGDPARLRLVQPGQQLDQGGLSGAVDTHDRGARPGRYAQRQVAEDRPVAMAGVLEPYPVEDDGLPRHRCRGAAGRCGGAAWRGGAGQM